MYVIGTAGHVDHGKSALVHALTGIDPDRLQEEKARGLTIDLGFAWLTLPSGREVSIVDVPGHERFIKNMLAGVGGIDLALLVVAADEGVMPQTREHLAIIDLLGIRSGVVAVTKADLADDDLLELVKADVEETLRGTTLEGSPLVACSAVTRAGLDALLAALDRRLDETQPRRDLGRPRLPIDRAFTISGFGTVVTGTLVDGTLSVGQEVEIVPGGIRSRIRGLQSHRRGVERAQPGSRTAVNLVGVAPQHLARGMVLTTPGWLVPTTAVDVRLRAVPGAERPIRHNMELTFHAGAAEVPARVRLLDAEALRPGDQGWAQLRLLEPVAVVRGDRFVVRTPNDTVGGGTVVDAHPKRHRRGHAPTLALLERLERGTPEEALEAELARRGPAELRALLRETDLAEEAALAAAQSLVAAGRALVLTPGPVGPGSLLLSSASFEALADAARRALDSYFAEHPLRSGMPKEELKSRLGLPTRVFNELLPRLLERGVLADRGAAVSLPGREPAPTPEQRRQAERFLAALAASPYAPPSDGLPDPELLAYLEEQGRVVRVSDGVVFAAEAYREMVDRIVAAIRAEGSTTLARVRDMFGTSRKYAQALLEHLDDRRITRRVGDERVLRRPEGGPS